MSGALLRCKKNGVFGLLHNCLVVVDDADMYSLATAEALSWT